VPPAIDRSDVQLLLMILETRAATISRAVLDDHFPKGAARLRAAKLLEPRGEVLAAPSLTDHDDEPVTASWSPQHQGFGYFSPTAGWVSVRAERLVTMGFNIPSVLLRMMVQFDLASRMGPIELLPNGLWELGDARIGRARSRLPIWFCRCLHDADVWQAVRDAAARRPTSGMRILLTSTAGRRMQGRIMAGHLVVSVEDVLDHNDPLSISADILAARLQGTSPLEVQGRIFLSPDGRTLTIDGRVITTFRSASQIRIIEKLVAGYREGKRFSFSELRDSASLGAKALSQVFGRKKWAELSQFLKFEDDTWGFDF
jgi:hypothetical protein